MKVEGTAVSAEQAAAQISHKIYGQDRGIGRKLAAPSLEAWSGDPARTIDAQSNRQRKPGMVNKRIH